MSPVCIYVCSLKEDVQIVFQQADANASLEVFFPSASANRVAPSEATNLSNNPASTFSFTRGSGLTRSVDECLSLRFFASVPVSSASSLMTCQMSPGVIRIWSCIAASFVGNVPLPSASEIHDLIDSVEISPERYRSWDLSFAALFPFHRRNHRFRDLLTCLPFHQMSDSIFFVELIIRRFCLFFGG